MYSEFARPAYFSGYECLHLNDGYADGTLDPVDQVMWGWHVLPLTYVAKRQEDGIRREFCAIFA